MLSNEVEAILNKEYYNINRVSDGFLCLYANLVNSEKAEDKRKCNIINYILTKISSMGNVHMTISGTTNTNRSVSPFSVSISWEDYTEPNSKFGNRDIWVNRGGIIFTIEMNADFDNMSSHVYGVHVMDDIYLHNMKTYLDIIENWNTK